jgi:acetyl esterase/lipase
VENIPYDVSGSLRLDVYKIREKRKAAPVIVFLYGGRWQHGSRRQYRPIGNALSRSGFVAVIPDYRKYPEVRFPAWVDDAARAIRWVNDSILQYGGDPKQIFVVGHSAGGHTAALLAIDSHYLRKAGLSPHMVRGYAILAGPVATTWTDADVQALMGPREGWPATYPMELADGSAPPMLLLHGGRDKVVSPANSTRLEAHIRQRGGCAASIMYSGLGHVGIVIAMALPQFNIAPVLEDLLKFLRRPLAACGGA